MEQQTKLLIFHNFFVIYQKLSPFSTKFLLIFEPLVPFFVSLFLGRKLEQLIKTGAINNYYLKIQRKSQFYYDVEFKLIATSKQVGNMIQNAINEVFSRLKI